MSLVDLDISSLEVGAVFKIENLFFKADESKANQSMSVVEEIYQFMILNPDITIEVRSHTNAALLRNIVINCLQQEPKQLLTAYMLRVLIVIELPIKGMERVSP